MQIQQTCKTHLENQKKPDNNDDNNNNKIRNSTISCMENLWHLGRAHWPVLAWPAHKGATQRKRRTKSETNIGVQLQGENMNKYIMQVWAKTL